MPGIIPRLREFGSGGFGFLAYLIANLYVMVRILPESHPYNNPANIGKFGIRHVISQAANHIEFNRKNIDQIIIFIISLAAFILLVFQVFTLFVVVFIRPVYASAFIGLFATPYPENDIAFVILDMVFGVPRVFCNPAGACSNIQGELPWPFHSALHSMFEFYSLAVLLLGVIIFLYYVIVVVGETALSGTPFGRRFNHIWAPLRLVAAIGALVPINYGLNSAQYITLTAAKYGSSVATNGWLEFNRVIRAQMTDRPQPTGQPTINLTSWPNPPDIQAVVGFMALANVCRSMYQHINNIEIEPYLVKYPDTAALASAVSFQNALDFYGGGDVVIRFGEQNIDYFDHKGRVAPWCGEITVHANEINQQPGAWQIQEAYYQLVLSLWENAELQRFGERVTYIHDQDSLTDPCSVALTNDNPDCTKMPLAQWRQQQLDQHQANFEAQLIAAWQVLRETGEFQIEDEVLERGWGGAGIWYNKIAQLNGAWISAVHNVPTPGKYPWVMEEVLAAKRKHDLDSSGYQGFKPNLSEKQMPNLRLANKHIATGTYEALAYMLEDDMNQSSGEIANDSNLIFTVMNVLFGTYSLFDIRNERNRHVHPLAQLTGIGKGILDGAVRNLGYSAGFAVGGGALSSMGPKFQQAGNIANAMSGMFLSITTIGLVAGFVLYYIIPFLPFIYFYFAVGGWVKSVFEAMVGVPLWALAHLRIDGNGFPGELASNGYFLIFEIFVRPILCVFGLVAGIAIFAAQARVLHEIFDLVIINLTGYDGPEPIVSIVGDATYKRHAVDEFFFTIIYVFILYMMGTASFKLIDMIPNSILRWMGSGVATFSDSREDPTQNLIQYASIGGGSIAESVTSGLQRIGHTGGSALGSMVKGMGLVNSRGGSVGGSGPATP